MSELPALVFLHYFGGSAREWTEVTAVLAGEHRCIALDLPGFGEAAGVTGFTVDDMADSVAARLRGQGLDRFVLVGHSMSGKVSIILASRDMLGLEALILVAPSPPSPEPMSEADREQMLTTHGQRQAAEDTLNKITGRPLPAPLFDRAVEDNLRSSPEAWAAWLEHGSREDWSARVGVLPIPTLVVTGERDPVLPAPIQERLTLPHFSKAKLVSVPGSGHLVPMEAPHDLAALIRGFDAIVTK